MLTNRLLNTFLLSCLIFCILPLKSLRSDDFEDDFGASELESTKAPAVHFQPTTGRLNQNFLLYAQPIENYNSYQERLDFEFETGANFKSFNAKLIPWGMLRSPDPVGGLPKNKTRAKLELKEAWLDYSAQSFEIRVGNQIITWGASDQINPTDQWNARDMTDLLLSQKLPQGTARLYLHPVEYSSYLFEILFSPYFRANIFPLDIPTDQPQIFQKNDSRWFLPLPTRVKAETISAPLRYRIETPTYPKTWQAGTRFQALRMGGWDFSLSYFNGVEKNPRFTFTKKGDALNPDLPLTLTIYPSYHRLQMFGFDGAGSLDVFNTTYGIRFETAYYYRDNTRARNAADEFRDDLLKDDYVQGVFGIDHTFEKKFLGTILYLNTMFIYTKTIPKIERPPGQLQVDGLPNGEPFDKNLVLYLEDRVTSLFKITNIIAASTINLDGYWSPGIGYQLTDNLKSTLSGDIFFALPSKKVGFFEQFQDNNRVSLGFSYTF